MSSPDWLELAKLQQANFHDRRIMEWRVLFGYWSSLGLAVFAVLGSDVRLSALAAILLLSLMFLLLPVVVVCAILPLQRSHAQDRAFLLYYIRRAEGVEPIPERPVPEKCPRHALWTTGQILASTLITLVAMILVWGAQDQPRSGGRAPAAEGARAEAPPRG